MNEEPADTNDVEAEQGESDWSKEVPSDDRLSENAKKEIETESSITIGEKKMEETISETPVSDPNVDPNLDPNLDPNRDPNAEPGEEEKYDGGEIPEVDTPPEDNDV